MNKENVLEYVEYALECAKYKCDTLEEAEDISQEALLEMLAVIDKGKDIENPKGWLSTVIERKKIDLLRRKYKSCDTVYDVDINQILFSDEEPIEELIKSEEYTEIRKQISYLAEIYRQVIFKYYIKNMSIKQIAEEIGISENTVKSRLDVGRKHIRKGMDMSEEKYVKQSMEPDDLWISINGRVGANNEPFDLVGQGDYIIMNILILAYNKPLELSELSDRIGISCAFLEPIVERLVEAQLMKRLQNRVYTDFIIFSADDMYKSFDLEMAYANEIYKEALSVVIKNYNEIETDVLDKLNTPQKNSLLSYFVVKTLNMSMHKVRDEVAGFISFDDYPDRPNGGKWHATGYHYPGDFDYVNDKAKKYTVSGESSNRYDSNDGKEYISVLEFETELGYTRKFWEKLAGRNDNSVEAFLKCMYMCEHNDQVELFTRYGLAVIPENIENIDVLIESGYISGDRKACIPILSEADFKKVLICVETCKNELVDRYRETYEKILKNNYISVPKHLKSVPEYLKYSSSMNLPMMIILKGKDEGIIFEGVKGNIPAVVIVEK